ncbi:MAG: glycerol-3-phosphate 1-O-acyltransferase PlsY [Fimbriimonadaceae bacterium]
MTLTAILILLSAYMVGSIPIGVLVCRAHGIDLFKFGSGNIGATNVYRAVGGRWAAVVFVADVLKGLGPTLVARSVFPAEEVLWMSAGAAATAGHCFSPFLRFRGGKGVACLLGMVLGVSLFISVCTLVVFALVFGVSRFVSLGSLIAVPTATVVSLATNQNPAVSIMFASVAVLTIVLHRKNIKRLINGKEPKFGKAKASLATSASADSDESKSAE